MSSKVALTAVAVVALGFTAGCGDDSGGDKKATGGDKAGGSSSAAPLSKAQLRKAALGKSDVKGFVITAMSDKDAADGGEPKSAKPECQPLASLMGSEFTPAPAASVFRTYSKAGAALGKSDDPKDGVAGMLRVSSYADDGAQRTVKELRDAVAACSGGFSLTDAEGKRQQLSKVKALPDPEFGDEAVAYQAVDQGADGGTITFAAARSGPHVTVTFTFNLVDPNASEVPRDLLGAQVAKLAKAAKSAGARS